MVSCSHVVVLDWAPRRWHQLTFTSLHAIVSADYPSMSWHQRFTSLLPCNTLYHRCFPIICTQTSSLYFLLPYYPSSSQYFFITILLHHNTLLIVRASLLYTSSLLFTFLTMLLRHYTSSTIYFFDIILLYYQIHQYNYTFHYTNLCYIYIYTSTILLQQLTCHLPTIFRNRQRSSPIFLKRGWTC